MTLNDFEKNISKHYLISALNGLWFTIPIGILFYQSFNITYTQLGLLELIAALTIILLELPSGIFSDFLGRKLTTFIGYILMSGGLIITGLSSTFLMFAIGVILWASSHAFLSGTKNALLFDSLKKLKREKEYLKIRSKIQLITAVTIVFASISAAYLFNINIRIPHVLFGIIIFFAAIVVLSMKEPHYSIKKYNLSNQFEHLKNSIIFAYSHKKVRWLILFSTLLTLPMFAFVNLLRQPYLIQIGYSIIQLGFIFALIHGISGLVASLSDKIERKIGEKKSFILITILYSTMFVFAGLLNTPTALTFIILLYITRDYKKVLIDNYMNHHIKSENRATVLSIQSLNMNIFTSIFIVLIGYSIDLYSMNAVLIAMGVILFISAIPFLYINSKKK